MTEIEEIEKRFKEKIEELRSELPKKYTEGKIATQNCAALTMRSFLEIIKVKNLNYINMASPLASIAHTCGAVNAALMIIGMIAGRNGKKELYQQAAASEGMKFIKRFNREFGSVQCLTLTGGYDLLTSEGMENYLKDRIWEKKCYKHVVVAIDIIGKIYKKEIARIFLK